MGGVSGPAKYKHSVSDSPEVQSVHKLIHANYRLSITNQIHRQLKTGRSSSRESVLSFPFSVQSNAMTRRSQSESEHEAAMMEP